MSYVIGPSIGLLKPYYLDLIRVQDGSTQIVSEKFSEDNEDIFLNSHSPKVFDYFSQSLALKVEQFALFGIVKGEI